MKKEKKKGKTSSYIICLSQDCVSCQSTLNALLGIWLETAISSGPVQPTSCRTRIHTIPTSALGHIIQRVPKVLLIDL